MLSSSGKISLGTRFSFLHYVGTSVIILKVMIMIHLSHYQWALEATEADSLLNKVLELQTQVIKAVVHK